ncbi:MAG: saccharopine dehydrogenase [Acidobacteria bacterium]|nr:MAG: saccharopine dehydrogenase [Acidobacteriota bacterium]REJ99139.1 MAG: saccharopine dehydrogenase [Acidobacteriota bacterium]REK16140.1 MAG: saccharopine dehydrogenase [Acidobacteriota bacterium]REK43821.1 MAG: saccharopine dehydrogenase [Acidobacteriota bacterium]
MNFLIYGAYGYTGDLIAREAAARGITPILAGRDAEKTRSIAEELGLDYRAFSLDDTEQLDEVLDEVGFVIHCAGPFSITATPMVEACLRTGTHYLDITGEIAVFEAMAALDEKAKQAGIMVMPGVGFDVVPTDSLARHLSNEMPDAEDLTLAFYGLGRISHGTQRTMTMNVGRGGAIRSDGEITPVPAAWKTREIDFGEVKKEGVTIPWGDVSTAFYTTGIPNIKVFTVMPDAQMRMLRLSNYIGWLLATSPVQAILQSQIPEGGPSLEEREKGKTYLWGRVTNNEGEAKEARLFGPEGYKFTMLTALMIAERIMSGEHCVGFQTPAGCYGADMVLEIEGVKREDAR